MKQNLQFKIGDYVLHNHTGDWGIITLIDDDIPRGIFYDVMWLSKANEPTSSGQYKDITKIDKFDDAWLKTGDKVLVRDSADDEWYFGFFSHLRHEDAYKYGVNGHGWKQCIPYNSSTAYLVGTTDNASDFYCK